MKTKSQKFHALICLSIAVVCCIGGTVLGADVPKTLKEAYGDYFDIGVAINRTIPARDNNVEADNTNRTMEQVLKDIKLVETQYNACVNENDLKWIMVHPNPGPDGYDFKYSDAYVVFGEVNKMYVTGHCLLWHSQTPGWVFEGTAKEGEEEAAAPVTPPAVGARGGRGGFGGGGGFGGFGGGRGGFNQGPRATREELLERMRNHIHTVVGRYKGRIKVWDVVNEALSDGGNDILRNSPWRQIIGDDFIAKAFQYAHEADPDAILRYNDYGLENPGKREKLKKLIKQLQDQNIPIHAIGTQTHINTGTSFETMDETLADLASIGLPVHITELDMNASRGGMRNTNADIEGAAARTQGGLISDADRRQSEAYVNLFKAILKHKDSVKLVVFWGANDDVSWLGAAKPLLFDAEDNHKPAFDALMKLAADYKAENK